MLAYVGMTKRLSSVDKESKYNILFGTYQQRIEKCKEYVRENALFFNRSLNYNKDNRGLVIIEAYLGLADHIYHIDAGLVKFKIPTTVEEYYKCQVIPVKKQL